MTAPAPDTPRIKDYDLSAPTEQSALVSLTKVFGAERAAELWERACQSSGYAVGHVTSPRQVERCAIALVLNGGACATVGRSVEIRLRTYYRLASRTGAPLTGERR